MNEWISVKDRLPEENVQVLGVLACNGKLEFCVRRNCYLPGCHYKGFVSWQPLPVTYWMPLPEPPKTETQEETTTNSGHPCVSLELENDEIASFRYAQNIDSTIAFIDKVWLSISAIQRMFPDAENGTEQIINSSIRLNNRIWTIIQIETRGDQVELSLKETQC